MNHWWVEVAIEAKPVQVDDPIPFTEDCTHASYDAVYVDRLCVTRFSGRRAPEQPEEMLLEFLQSSYEAGAERGGWDRTALERQPGGGG